MSVTRIRSRQKQIAGNSKSFGDERAVVPSSIITTGPIRWRYLGKPIAKALLEIFISGFTKAWYDGSRISASRPTCKFFPNQRPLPLFYVFSGEQKGTFLLAATKSSAVPRGGVGVRCYNMEACCLPVVHLLVSCSVCTKSEAPPTLEYPSKRKTPLGDRSLHRFRNLLRFDGRLVTI